MRTTVAWTRSPRPLELSSDLRLHLFAVLFAVGTILHELEFVLEQVLVGPFGEYMERWSRAIPSTGWSSEVGVALHLANVAISLLLLVLRWRRELLCVLAGPFLLSQLASPNRIASHSGLMAGGLLITLIFGLAEWLQYVVGRSQPASPRTDWYGWTLTGLTWVCALTYFFAFFYKLNPVWFSPDSTAPGFLIRPLSPILDRLGAPPGYRSLLGGLAIYGTLLVELVLPVLLFLRPTRLFACFVGLAFHLPMIAQGIGNFPMLIIAFYPAFLSLAQTRALLRCCLTRPRITCLVGTFVLGGFGIWVVQRAPKLISLYGNAPDLNPFVRIANTGLTCGFLVLLLYATLTLGTWLLARRSQVTVESDHAAGDAPLHTPGRLARYRVSPGSAAAAAMLLLSAVFVYNNVAQFFGLPAAGAMIMFSGIRPDRSNHLFMPSVTLINSYGYVSIVRFDPQGIETREAREFRAFTQWLNNRSRSYQVNLNFLRYHMDRICRSAPGGTVRLKLQKQGGDTLDFENVCAEPTMRRYVAIPIAGPCNPPCGSVLRRWARGELQND